jgi:hypothetical protein
MAAAFAVVVVIGFVGANVYFYVQDRKYDNNLTDDEVDWTYR